MSLLHSEACCISRLIDQIGSIEMINVPIDESVFLDWSLLDVVAMASIGLAVWQGSCDGMRSPGLRT